MISKGTMIHLVGADDTYYKMLKDVDTVKLRVHRYKDNADMVAELVRLGYAEKIRVFQLYASDNASFVWLELQGYKAT